MTSFLTIKNRIITLIDNLASIKKVYNYEDFMQSQAVSDYPFAVVQLEEPDIERAYFGSATNMEANCKLTVRICTYDSDQDNVSSDIDAVREAVRIALTSDSTLKGYVIDIFPNNERENLQKINGYGILDINFVVIYQYIETNGG